MGKSSSSESSSDSSSSDEDDSSSSGIVELNTSLAQASPKEKKKRKAGDEEDLDDDDSSSSSSSHGSDDSDDDDDDTSESSKEGESLPRDRHHKGVVGRTNDVDDDSANENDSDDYNDDDDDDDVNDDPDLPLAERLRLNEEQGISLHGVRARKSRALKLATERLAKLKHQDTSKNNTSNKTTIKEKKKEGADVKQKKSKSKSKHAPTEVSSKRSEFFKRGARRLNESGLGIEIGAHRYKAQDPRQSNLTGHLDEDHFEHNYAFLDEMREKEIIQLKKRIVARKTTGSKGQQLRRKLQLTHDSTGGSLEQDQEELKRLLSIKATMERNKLERTAKQSVQKKLRDEVAQGQRGAYFLKKKDKKRLVLEAKFDELRKRGGDKAVEKVLTKRRRKNKSRDASLFAK